MLQPWIILKPYLTTCRECAILLYVRRWVGQASDIPGETGTTESSSYFLVGDMPGAVYVNQSTYSFKAPSLPSKLWRTGRSCGFCVRLLYIHACPGARTLAAESGPPFTAGSPSGGSKPTPAWIETPSKSIVNLPNGFIAGQSYEGAVLLRVCCHCSEMGGGIF